MTHYYVYLDDARYEVTKDEYARIYGSQSDTDVLVSILREILGERMPGILFRCVWRGNDRK